jgi:copper(I)-binding protein
MKSLCLSVLIGSCALAPSAIAEVTVRDAWVRGTVPAQTTTGAFMTITSSEDAKLVGVSTPAARSTEIHRTVVSGGVNHMHAENEVALPARKPVAFQPGGHHFMLMALAKPLSAGDKVPITLVVEDRAGTRSTVEVLAAVRPLGR